MKRDQIIKFINDYLKIKKWPDDINGLVVKGTSPVNKIVTGVTPSMELFQKAEKFGAQMVITHHYLHLKKDKYTPVPSYEKERVKYLKKHQISFANYHLSLDFHNEIGNEVLTLKQFGLTLGKKRFYYNSGLYGGKLKKTTTLTTLVNKAGKIYKIKPLVYKFGPKKINNIAVISGSAHNFYDTADKDGAKTIITGNPKVETPDVVKELKLNIICCGHHNTEKIGIKALGELVAKKFNIKHKFIDIPNKL